MNDLKSDNVLQVLQNGTIELEGLLPWCSNYAFLVRVCDGPADIEAVYKPQRGERPLWDFPQGTLCLREQAAFVVSEALGWRLVPPTVLREGQHGLGSIQLFIDHDPEQHYFTIEGDKKFQTQLQKYVLFDALVNNADRKAGHILIQEATEPGGTPRLWGIDHGICFHTDPKLRTVIWEFGGAPIPAPLCADLEAFRARLLGGEESAKTDDVLMRLESLLSQPEIDSLCRRLNRLMERASFPQPGAGRHYPWPPV
jgi:uncharacterized repeat protein (TIGR03843 family)